MRGRSSLLMVAGLTAAFFPLSLSAQFQPPTQEELTMKSEPKAPGAAAVYLYREETVDDNLHYHGFYERVKILSDKGKELATVGVPYPKGKFSVTDVKARTIHADGTIIPLDVKPTDLVEHKGTGTQINKMVFTLPSVEVGSILEYRWQLRYDDDTLSSPYWDVQQQYFVRKAHYSFLAFKFMDRVLDSKGNSAGRLLYSYNLPKDQQVTYVQTTGKYTLDVTDVAAIPDEEYMPPLSAALMNVKFYYSPYVSQEDFWKSEGGRWSKDMEKFAHESGTLKEAVSQIVMPSDNEDAKAHKLYAAVMALENTDYTRRKSASELKAQGLKAIKQAEDVWKQKSGSSDEIALLYLAMARIAGLKAYPVAVSNRNTESFNPYYLSLSQLDDVLVVVTTDGKETVLDPGTRYAPYGQLDWRHASTSGIRETDKGVMFATTHGINYKEATTLRVADLTIAKDGSVTGTVRVSMTGPEALHWRHLAIENDEDEVKKQFNEKMKSLVPDGVTADFDHFLGLQDYNSVLMGIVKISGNMGTATGKRVFLPGVFFESHVKHPFVAEEKRITTVDMHFPDSVRDEVTYRLPDEFAVESAPAAADLPWKGHAAFVLKSVADKNSITVTRNLVTAFTLLDPKEYTDLRDYFQKIAAADQQQLVLTAATPVAATPVAGKGQ